jgi:hypothetical protein
LGWGKRVGKGLRGGKERRGDRGDRRKEKGERRREAK